jgi:exodeoxyribonuclease VII small subunit
MKDKDLNFEKALADLEGIVEKLEKGGLSLNESLGLFEKGVHLARFLRDELGKAEQKVEILLKDEKGDIKAQPFGLDDEEGEKETEKDDDDGDDEEDDEDADAGKESAPKPKAKPSRAAKKKDDDGALPF